MAGHGGYGGGMMGGGGGGGERGGGGGYGRGVSKSKTREKRSCLVVFSR